MRMSIWLLRRGGGPENGGVCLLRLVAALGGDESPRMFGFRPIFLINRACIVCMVFGPGFPYKLGHSLLSNRTADTTAFTSKKNSGERSKG